MKRLTSSTRLHSATSQKNAIFLVAALRTLMYRVVIAVCLPSRSVTVNLEDSRIGLSSTSSAESVCFGIKFNYTQLSSFNKHCSLRSVELLGYSTDREMADLYRQ
jgi:hypothetical protein